MTNTRSLSRRAFLERLAGVGGAGAALWLAAACTTAPTPTPSPAKPLAGASPAAAASAPAPTPTAAATGAVETPAAAAVPLLPEGERVLRQVSEVKQVARLIGEGSINDTPRRWGLYGGDLGHMFDMGDKLYMVFGDSYGCCIPGTGGPGNAGDWRKNCMAIISDRDPADGLTFDDMITDKPGHAAELLHRTKFDFTVIPTNGIAVGQRMFLHYMAVMAWGKPGEWALNEAGLAYSDDGGHNWTKDANAKWDAQSNFGQVAFARSGEDVYLFGIPAGRFGGVKLAKVPQSSLLDKSAYRYYTGSAGGGPQWSADESAAALIVPAPVGELSVMWNAYLGRWIMTYLDERQAALVIREAPQPWGPWSPGLPLVSGSAYPALYGPYMHPWYVEGNGEVIYFTMSLWGPYSVFWMRARLLKA